MPDDVRRRLSGTTPSLGAIAVGRHPQGSGGDGRPFSAVVDGACQTSWRICAWWNGQRPLTWGELLAALGRRCKSAREGRAGVIVIGQAFIILV